MAMILIAVATAPVLVGWLVRFSLLDLWDRVPFFYCTIYSGSVPAILLLVDLFCLLQRISHGAVFAQVNVACLRRISWYCFLGGFLCLFSGLYYMPFFMVAFVAAFVGLIVRVVKNVFEQALLLQQEIDYTI